MKKQNLICLYLALCLGLPVVTGMLTGCAGDRYTRSTGQYIDDKTLAIRVANALRDTPEYKLNSVTVQSFRAVIQLSGFVNTADQKRKAEDIAKRVEGVQRVENNITVKPE
jgi:hyperosmotically inducible protein